MHSARRVPAEFIRAHTRPARPPLVPEVTVRVAADVVALWEAMEAGGGGAGEEPPFWAAAWPGGQALARYVLDAPALVRGRGVLDLGSGSGLVALAAALAGASAVTASEIDPFGVAAIGVNAELNRGVLDSGVGTAGIRVVGDVLDGEPPAGVVVLAGDVCYDRAMTERVLPFLARARARGCRVLIGDPGRPYLPRERLVPLRRYEVPDGDGGPARPTTVWELPEAFQTGVARNRRSSAVRASDEGGATGITL